MECRFCAGELEKVEIKKFNYWTVYLHPNQSYLGRVYILLNRHGPGDTTELTEDEWKESKEVMDKITKILKSLYNPNFFSYLVLQNRDRNHFHFHIMPRYKERVERYGEEFVDEMWKEEMPDGPVPSPKNKPGEEVLNKIIEDIKKEL
jgi:diadenosine tetraphosphate (Ap4A) HIT family hydrolase